MLWYRGKDSSAIDYQLVCRELQEVYLDNYQRLLLRNTLGVNISTKGLTSTATSANDTWTINSQYFDPVRDTIVHSSHTKVEQDIPAGLTCP